MRVLETAARCAWQSAKLKEVARIERDTLQPQEIVSGTKHLGLEHIESGGKILGALPVGKGDLASSKFKFTAQHILYGKLRPYLAKIACPEFSGICSTDILPILPGARLDRRFLCYYLRQPSMVEYANSRAAGANLPRLSPAALADFEIPLPPIEEQRRIAAVLDKADELRAKRRAALAELDTLTQSIFHEMFDDPVSNERGWPERQVSDFVASFESGKSIAADDEEDTSSPYRVLKVSAVTSLEFRAEESKATPAGYTPPQSHIVRRGDLLFSRANTSELIGATAYVFDTPPRLLLPDKLWRFVWHEIPQADPQYIRYLFRQPRFRQEIAKRATGTSGSMKNISQEKVMAINVGLPPLSLQRNFAGRVTAIEDLKAKQRTALAELDALFASLQHLAFRGRL